MHERGWVILSVQLVAFTYLTWWVTAGPQSAGSGGNQWGVAGGVRV